MLGTNILNSAINISWLDISFTNIIDNIVLLDISIFVGKIAQFYNTITAYFIDKKLFYVICYRFNYKNLVDVTISYKMFTISCIFNFKLVVLRL